MVKLTFIDLRTKKKFVTDNFTIKKMKNGAKMAMTKAPSGVKATRFVAREFKV